jgi:hypothetical protein
MNYMTPTPILQNDMKITADIDKRITYILAGTGLNKAGLFARVPAGQIIPQDWCGGGAFAKLTPFVNQTQP